MPQIEEYLPQVQAPEGLGGVSPNTEYAGAMGRGIEKLGADIAVASQVIHKRDVQQESADAYSVIADQRASSFAKLQQQTQDGTLDVDKFMEDFDNSNDDFASKLNTSEGKQFFQRQQSRLRGSLLHDAITGSARIAANESMGKWTDATNKNSAVLERDPTKFAELHDQAIEVVDNLIATGGLPEKSRAKAIAQMNSQYAEAALIGHANGVGGPKGARFMLKEGGLGNYLNVEQRHNVLGQINQIERADETQAATTARNIEKARKANEDKWTAENFEKMQDGTLPAKDIAAAVRKGTIPWTVGTHMLNVMEQNAKKELPTDPRIKNTLTQRIVNPQTSNPITSQDDILPYVGNGISIKDFNQLNSLLNKTPEQQAHAQGEKALFDSARKTIRFKNMMTNQYDVLGEQKLAQFMSDYLEAKKQIKDQGGSMSDLLNPNNKMYFGARLQNYQTSTQEQMTHVSQGHTNEALGLKTNESDKPATPVKNAKKPNETQSQYLKRMGL